MSDKRPGATAHGDYEMASTKKSKPDLASLVAQAEQAVASVADSDLKRVAFEKILGTLLGETPGSQVRQAQERRQSGSGTLTTVKPSRKQGPHARIDELIQEGFFKSPRTLGDVRQELATRGFHIPRTSLSSPLQRFCQTKHLRRQKLSAEGKAKNYAYSNW